MNDKKKKRSGYENRKIKKRKLEEEAKLKTQMKKYFTKNLPTTTIEHPIQQQPSCSSEDTNTEDMETIISDIEDHQTIESDSDDESRHFDDIAEYNVNDGDNSFLRNYKKHLSS